MDKKQKKLIRYTDRDFNSIKESLIRYTKRYYPDVYQDFSEASFGSLMLDTVSYVGDVLSFYLDYQANESFLDTAIEYDNILRHGEQVGYRPQLKANSFGVVTLYILIPSQTIGSLPDEDYLPTSLTDPNITEIVSVIDDEGHEYFEVDYLSQDTIFRSVVNKDQESSRYAPEKIVTTSVPRRFIVFNRFNQVFLKFGYGSESLLKNNNITHPSNVALQMHGRNYEKDVSFDPSNLLETDKFGIAPANTTLRVVYRTNSTDSVNIATGQLINVVSPIFVFGSNATNAAKIQTARCHQNLEK